MASRNSPSKTKANDRIYARVNDKLKQHIQHAADLKGLDLTSYVLSTLVADADRTVQEHEFMLLSQQDREAFATAIINPPAANSHLVAAAKRYKKRAAR